MGRRAIPLVISLGCGTRDNETRQKGLGATGGAGPGYFLSLALSAPQLIPLCSMPPVLERAWAAERVVDGRDDDESSAKDAWTRDDADVMMKLGELSKLVLPL